MTRRDAPCLVTLTPKGGNPFDAVTLVDKKLSTIVKLYDPPYSESIDVYNHIKVNLEAWVNEAIAIRGKH
jgi:hypothetical protein